MGWTFEESWFDVGQGQQTSPNRSNLLWAPPAPIHWVPSFFLRQPGHEAVHSSSSGTDAKNEWGHASPLSQYALMGCTGAILLLHLQRL